MDIDPVFCETSSSQDNAFPALKQIRARNSVN